MKRSLLMLGLSVLAASCGRDPTDDDAQTLLTVDPALTLSTFFGGDVGLAVGYDCDTVSGPVSATARGVVLATSATPDIVLFNGDTPRFLLTIPESRIGELDTADDFGNPAVIPITISADCDGRPSISRPYAITYIRAQNSGVAPAGVDRLWSSDAANEILACDGFDLVRYGLQSLTDRTAPVELARYEVGFACTLGELRGDVGGRRYFTTDRGGIAAIDPGPTVVWHRSLIFEAVSAAADQDPIVIQSQANVRQVVVLDRLTGADKVGPLALAYNPLNALTRDPSGNIIVLTYDRVGVESLYYLERFDSAGVSLGAPIFVARYGRTENNQQDVPIADFSFDGTRLYFNGNDGTDLLTQWIASIPTAGGTPTQLTAAGINHVLGEAYGRLLVASDDYFQWIDPASGGELSSTFAPDSGINFLRLRVEADGRTVMLADQSGSNAAGFYVFDADGTSIARVHADDTAFSWLASGPDGGSIVVVVDPTGNEVHDLGPASGFFAP